MAVPSNTIQNVARVGVREDLSDKIAELFPDDTPFQNAIGTSKVNNTYTEWQTDSLAAADENNAAVQGDDLANEARANTTRVGTHTQIFTKVVGASTTVEWTNKAGRKSELARELMKAGREMKTDMEKRFLGNYASVAATASVAGQTAGALAWLTTNTDVAAGGANGGFSSGIVAAATNGTTPRAYTEALLKGVLQSIWNEGGNPKMVITNGSQKQTAAAFAGLADARRETGNKKLTIVAGADIYVSDFGEVQFVPDRFASSRDALIVDPEYWDVGIGQAMTTVSLAKTGLAERKALHAEVALRCLNEAASGCVRDLS
jgi:ribosomal protein S18 acetylase RimI-like enzyme